MGSHRARSSVDGKMGPPRRLQRITVVDFRAEHWIAHSPQRIAVETKSMLNSLPVHYVKEGVARASRGFIWCTYTAHSEHYGPVNGQCQVPRSKQPGGGKELGKPLACTEQHLRCLGIDLQSGNTGPAWQIAPLGSSCFVLLIFKFIHVSLFRLMAKGIRNQQ